VKGGGRAGLVKIRGRGSSWVWRVVEEVGGRCKGRMSSNRVG